MPVIIGYYQAWKRYRNFTVDKIDPFRYTHLIYAFAGVKDNRIYIIDEWGDITQNGYRDFNSLKNINPRLKTLLAVGGWADGDEISKAFSDMAKSFTSRRIFIDSCIDMLYAYDFDGIDLDWEYPCLKGGCRQDKANFAHLVEEMSSEFSARGFLLTAAVAAGEDTMKTSYEVRELSRYLDFIHLMTYDMHSYETGCVNHNAPLYSSGGISVSKSIHAWLQAGADSKKLILGIPAYGRQFTLTDPNRTFIGAPSSGSGDPSCVDYNEIIELEKSGWTKQYDKHQKVPYIYKGTQWIGYDDPASVRRKVRYARRYGLGGIMVWSVDGDLPQGGPSLLDR